MELGGRTHASIRDISEYQVLAFNSGLCAVEPCERLNLETPVEWPTFVVPRLRGIINSTHNDRWLMFYVNGLGWACCLQDKFWGVIESLLCGIGHVCRVNSNLTLNRKGVVHIPSVPKPILFFEKNWTESIAHPQWQLVDVLCERTRLRVLQSYLLRALPVALCRVRDRQPDSIE